MFETKYDYDCVCKNTVLAAYHWRYIVHRCCIAAIVVWCSEVTISAEFAMIIDYLYFSRSAYQCNTTLFFEWYEHKVVRCDTNVVFSIDIVVKERSDFAT